MSRPPIDLLGQRFGRLVVLRRGNRPSGRTTWVCLCDCGVEHFADGGDLKSGRMVSCGCKRLEMLKTSALTHGASDTRTFSIWKDMRRRCQNASRPEHQNYGARGISVCERWSQFATFLADMGPCPDGWSIERINNDGNYEPANCRWMPRNQQQANTRRVIRVDLDGEVVTLTEACRRRGVPYGRVRDRVRFLGWTIERALSEPKKVNGVLYA